ncbi:MAG: hypothetical protein E2O52_07815 [Gammaproteobacteria bacterium]|nr:MAG: hypothetical protein E2O52_07815 [Gammaproteobacteria bacterium]
MEPQVNSDRSVPARLRAGTGAMLQATMCVTFLCTGLVSAADDVEDIATEEQSSGRRSEDTSDANIVLDQQNCVRRIDIDHTKIIDDQAILFYMRRSTIFLNKLPRRCSGLRMSGTFSYDTRTGELCNVDIIHVVNHFGGGFRRGVGCGLGKFKPITEEQVELIKEIGPGDF